MKVKSSSLKFLLLVLAVFSVFALFLPYFTALTYAAAGEDSLTTILNNLGFKNRASSSAQTFPSGTYNISLLAEFAGYYDQNTLSYYQVSTSVYNLVFSGPEGGFEYVTPPVSKSFTINYQFGLSLYSGDGHRYFTETSRNPDSIQHAKVYESLDVPGMYFIGFENMYGQQADRDYNDMVVSLCPQCQVTFNQTGVSTDFTGNVVTIDGTGYMRTNLPKSFGWNNYSGHSFSFASPLNVNATKRYVWNSTSGLSTLQSGTLNVTSSGSVTGNYKTQYYLTVNTNPAEVLSLNPSAVSGQGWYYSGTTATVDAVQVVTKVAGQSRYDFRFWTGATPTSPPNKATVLMNGPKTATANYQLQYNITFYHTGVGSDFTGTVVIIDTTNYNRAALPLSFWWDSGTDHNFAFQSPLVVTSNTKQYVWNTTSGLSSLQSGLITVSASGSIIGNYKIQYYLTVNSPYGTTGGQGWYYSGVTTYARLDAGIIDHGNLTRRVFTSWSGDASGTNYAQSDSIIMDGAKTATANWKTQYYLTVGNGGHGTATGENWYDAGSSAPFSISPTTVSGGTGTQYVFIRWIGSGTGSYTGPDASHSVTMNNPITETAQWKTQYYLTVTSPYGTTGGQGWYNISDTTYATVTPLIVPGPTGVQYVFTNWSGDASGTTSPSSPITMDAPKHAIANWKTQYQITVTASPSEAIGGQFKVTYTQCGTIYTDVYKITVWTEWVDADTTVTVSEPQTIISHTLGTSYKFESYNPSNTVTMNQAKTITLVYKTQYLVSFTQTGSAVAPSVTYTADTDPTQTVPFDVWVKAVSQITYTYQDIVLGSGVRYVLTSVTPASPQTVNGPLTITGNYKTQYFLTVTSPYGVTSGQAWYDVGATAYAGLTSGTFDHGNGTRRLFTQWGGDASGTNYAQSNQINMGAPKTALANWKTQYLLTVVTDPSGLTPQPTRNPAGETGPANGWWYDASTSVTLTAQSVTSYSFNRWDVDGSLKTIGENPISVSMNTCHTATAHYTPVITYTLAITTTAGGTTNPTPVTYSYSAGITVNVTATPSAGYRFDHWVLNGSNAGSTSPISVLMDRNRSLQAVFAETHTLTISVSEGGTTNPAPGTYTYPTPTDVPVTATPNVGYRLDHWIYDNNNIGSQNPITVHAGSSHTLKAVFVYSSPIAVGGPVFPIEHAVLPNARNAFSPILVLGITLVAFGFALIATKKKRKK